MRTSRFRRARLALTLLLAPAVVIALASAASAHAVAAAGPGRAALATPGRPGPAVPWIRPEYANIDCNSPASIYYRIKPNIQAMCADPVHVSHGRYTRFIDNGYYVGHDEPNVRFISDAPGSGHEMTYYMKLPAEPARVPTPSGSVTNSGELTVPWFGLELCDPLSYPQRPCTPDSDRNLGGVQRNAAGSALFELQFYPPGYAPFIAGESCGATWWCGVVSIDSLECSYNMTYCNPNCTEVPNFAFLQTNGLPTGPPGPQASSLATFIPNRHTLRMYPGDLLRVSITDPHRGLTATVRDLTTGRTGYMAASARNGFMDTRISDCSGRRWTFHAEYNTARRQNQLPWLAGDGGVIMTQELGHFDSCRRVLHQQPGLVSVNYQTCAGGIEGGQRGPGPCTGRYVQRCRNPEAQGARGPVACPTRRFSFTVLCEFTGSFCVKRGVRSFTFNGQRMEQTAPVAYCLPKDLDFDGESYLSRSWPDGTRAHPTPLAMIGPFSDGRTYPVIQFATSVGGFERLCQVATGRHCQAPPLGARFYPYWTLSRPRAAGLRQPFRSCAWEFGRAIPGVTVQAFGGDRQYGGPDHGRYLGTLISRPRRNAALTGTCSARRRHGSAASSSVTGLRRPV